MRALADGGGYQLAGRRSPILRDPRRHRTLGRRPGNPCRVTIPGRSIPHWPGGRPAKRFSISALMAGIGAADAADVFGLGTAAAFAVGVARDVGVVVGADEAGATSPHPVAPAAAAPTAARRDRRESRTAPGRAAVRCVSGCPWDGDAGCWSCGGSPRPAVLRVGRVMSASYGFNCSPDSRRFGRSHGRVQCAWEAQGFDWRLVRWCGDEGWSGAGHWFSRSALPCPWAEKCSRKEEAATSPSGRQPLPCLFSGH